MILAFHQTILDLRLTVFEAFQTAYVSTFDKEGHIVPDFCEYELHKDHPWYDLPMYVKAWMAKLKEPEMKVITCTLCTKTVQTNSHIVKFTSSFGIKQNMVPDGCYRGGRDSCREKEFQPIVYSQRKE